MTWQPNRQKFLNGGYAIPLGNNISLLMGNSHEQGGITGITPKDDIEAEGGEVIQKTKDSKGGNVLRIFSKYPMFGDYSPSELVQAGANPNEVFKQQEQYKDRLGLNDDGTPKQRAKYGDRIEYELGGNKKNQQQEEEQPFVVPGTGLNLETTEDYKKQQLQQFSETTGLPLEYLEELFEDDDFIAESLANFENETNADNSKIPVNNDYEDAGLFDLFPQQKQEIPVQTPIKNNVEDNTENDEENVSENEEQQRKLYQFKPYENEDEDNNFVNPSLQQNEDDYYTPYDDEYLDASDLDKPVYSVNDVNPSVLPTRKEKEYKVHSETDIANVLNNKSTRAVTDEIWNTLNESDLTYAQKIAIMANWYQESTWRPDVKTGDHGHSYGLAQFNDSGELGQLKNYAKENNLDISKASTQTKFAIKRTKDKGGLKRTRGTQGFEDITEKQAFEMWNSEDPEKATIAYMLLYERPSWAASGNRINAAKVLQRVYPDSTAVSKKLGGEFKLGGLSRSKDYGSKKKPYPSVNKKDFAGGHRSYPIPTKADATDALRLAGLHHRSDVKAKVYKKYPSLRKKAELGLKEDDDNNQDTLNNFGDDSKKPTRYSIYNVPIDELRYYRDDGNIQGANYKGKQYDLVASNPEVNASYMTKDPFFALSLNENPRTLFHPDAILEYYNKHPYFKDDGVKEIYPELDLLTMGSIGKDMLKVGKNLYKLRKMPVSYTGVPERYVNGFMEYNPRDFYSRESKKVVKELAEKGITPEDQNIFFNALKDRKSSVYNGEHGAFIKWKTSSDKKKIIGYEGDNSYIYTSSDINLSKDHLKQFSGEPNPDKGKIFKIYDKGTGKEFHVRTPKEQFGIPDHPYYGKVWYDWQHIPITVDPFTQKITKIPIYDAEFGAIRSTPNSTSNLMMNLRRLGYDQLRTDMVNLNYPNYRYPITERIYTTDKDIIKAPLEELMLNTALRISNINPHSISANFILGTENMLHDYTKTSNKKKYGGRLNKINF